jgi:uncharacterized phage protein gp47/JayE
LRDIRNQLVDADVSVDSDWYVRACAVASAITGLYQHQAWIARQILPDTADTEYMERWASLFGLARLPASSATGTLRISGTAGSVVTGGAEVQTAAGTRYTLVAGGTIGGGGTLDVLIDAATAGAAGNLSSGATLTLSAPPAGVTAAALLMTDLTGGADIEADAALLARLLRRIQNPPHGGAAHDYETWAREVPGVAGAWVLPLRRGIGSVDVAVMAAGGLPSAQLVADTQAYISARRPVTADCLVVAPTAVPVAVTAVLDISGTTLVTATAQITQALAEYVAALPPGGTVVRNRIAALIADTAGVVDFTLSAPAANVTTTADDSAVEIPTLGTVTLT